MFIKSSTGKLRFPPYFPHKEIAGVESRWNLVTLMARRKKTAAEVEFIRKTPRKYREAVIAAFLKYIVENDWAKPLAIIEDFSVYSDMTYDEVYDAAYDRIDKLKQGRNTAVNDPVFFEMANSFMWRHAPENIAEFSLPCELYNLGHSMSEFLQYDVGEKSDEEEKEVGRFTHFGDFHDGFIYKLEVTPNLNYMTLHSEDRRMKPHHDNKYYFVRLDCKEHKFDIGLSFDSSSNFFFFGIFYPETNMFFMKESISNDTMYMVIELTDLDNLSESFSISRVLNLGNKQKVGVYAADSFDYKLFDYELVKVKNFRELHEAKEKTKALLKRLELDILFDIGR